jgi:N4-gp56 family major capsid protein
MPILPPGVVSNSLAGFPQIFYNRVAVESWLANTPFLSELTDPKPFPRRSGRTMQFYGVRNFSGSTTKATEGIPGPSLSLSQAISQVYLDQYVDWIGISDVVQDMFINSAVTDATRQLSYRGALTGNLVASSAFDAAAVLDSTARVDLGDNEFLSSATIRRCETSLVNNNVPGRDDGMYSTVMSALTSYDLFSDNSAGSAVDVLKRTPQGASELKAGIVRSFNVMEWAGCRIIRTSTVPTYANYPSAGKTGYGTFVVGRDAMFASELAGVSAPKSPNYAVKVTYLTEPDLSNPTLQTSCLASFNFYLGVSPRPNLNGTSGFRRIRAEVSIV